MCKIVPFGITALKAPLNGDAGQGGRVRRDCCDMFPLQIGSHSDRHKGAACCHFLQGRVTIRLGNWNDLTKPFNHSLWIVGLFSNELNLIVQRIPSELLSTAIKNHSPHGWNKADIDAVFFCQKAKIIRLLNAKRAHSHRKPAHHQYLRAQQEGCAPSECFGS